jgi:PKD repeat protein
VLILGLAASASGASLYLPDYGSGPPESISGYSLAADGSPSPLAGSPFAVGPSSGSPGGILDLAFTPEGTSALTGFLFKGGLLALAAGADGSLAPAQNPILSPSVTSVAVSPDGRFAYATTREFGGVMAAGVLGYSIGPGGALTELSGAPFDMGEEFGELAITPNGHWLYASGGSSAERFAIGPDGNLSGETEEEVEGYGLRVSPDGHFLFSGDTGYLNSYAIGIDGSLTEVGETLSSPGASFGYFAVAPDSRHIYVPDRNGNVIVTLAVAADGALSRVGSTPIEVANTVAVTPDGRFLYFARTEPEDVGVAAIGADGMPTILPAKAPWRSGESEPIVFRPGPVPIATFGSQAGRAGSPSSFDASGSQRAARYEWSFGDGTTLKDGGPTPSHTYGAAGTYTVNLRVYDSLGCSTAAVYSGQSTICPGGSAAQSSATLAVSSAAVPTPPVITSLKLSRGSFPVRASRHSKRKLGTAFLYGLNEPARVAFTIERREPGRRVAGSCKPVTKKNRSHGKCTRFRSLGGFDAAATAGHNHTPFRGRVKGKLLDPRPYRATVIATDATGLHSQPRRVSFSVVRSR